MKSNYEIDFDGEGNLVEKKTDCCPLCKSDVGKLRVSFVNYVCNSKENMEAYTKGDLTYESWLNEIKKEINND